MGLQAKLNLRTIKGKVGYKVSKFQIMSQTAGSATGTFVAQIFKKDQTGAVSAVVDFSNPDLVAVVFANFSSSVNSPTYETIIFDNEMFNQNVFVTIQDPDGGTQECNYYVELEAKEINDLESTMLTLKNIRTITSR